MNSNLISACLAATLSIGIVTAPDLSLAEDEISPEAKSIVSAAGVDLPDLQGAGRIADTNIYYARSCYDRWEPYFYLVRKQANGSTDVWKMDTERCVYKPAWRDIDGDGGFEIRAVAGGVGMGSYTGTANFIKWDDNMATPEVVLTFDEEVYSEWMGLYEAQGLGPIDSYVISVHETRYLPIGATCRSQQDCEIVEEKYFCITACEGSVPVEISRLPNWSKFKSNMLENLGYKLGNLTSEKALADLELDAVEAANVGITPEASAERQAAFDAWLSE